MSNNSDLSKLIPAVAIHFLCKLLEPVSFIIKGTITSNDFLSELAVDLLAYGIVIVILILVVNLVAKVKPPHR